MHRSMPSFKHPVREPNNKRCNLFSMVMRSSTQWEGPCSSGGMEPGIGTPPGSPGWSPSNIGSSAGTSAAKLGIPSTNLTRDAESQTWISQRQRVSWLSTTLGGHNTSWNASSTDPLSGGRSGGSSPITGAAASGGCPAWVLPSLCGRLHLPTQ